MVLTFTDVAVVTLKRFVFCTVVSADSAYNGRVTEHGPRDRFIVQSKLYFPNGSYWISLLVGGFCK